MVTIALRRASERAAIRAAVHVLKRGGVIAFPTETVYGFGCDPRNTTAVAKIFKIKGRDEGKPLQLIAGTRSQVTRLSSVTGMAGRVARRYWPGPLTLLLPLRRGQRLSSRAAPRRTIGIRVSSHRFLQRLTKAFGGPIAATSANVSGKPTASSGRGIIRIFQDRAARPDLVLDGGTLPRCKPSTVARIRSDGTVEVLRQGSARIQSA